MSSNTASMTMSASFSVVVAGHALEQAHALVHLLLRQAALGHRAPRSSCARCPGPCRALPGSVSSTLTGMPALAKFIAMPPPIVPAPISAADLISRVGVSSGTSGILLTCALGEEQVAQRLRFGRSRAASRTARARAARPWRTAASPPPRRSRRSPAARDSRDTPWRCARAQRRRTRRGLLELGVASVLVLRDLPAFAHHAVGEAAMPPAAMSPLTISSIKPSSSAFSAPIGSPLTIIVQRALHADHARQALRAAARRAGCPSLTSGSPSCVPGDRHAVVASQRQLEPAAEREAVDRRDDRLGHGVHVATRAPAGWPSRPPDGLPNSEMSAPPENARPAPVTRNAARRVVLAFLDRVQDPLQHALAHGRARSPADC